LQFEKRYCTIEFCLAGDGKPDDGLFLKNNLYMNDKGCKAWTSLLTPVITAAAEKNK